MNKTIAIHISFSSPQWREKIEQGVRRLGYTPRFLTGEVRLEDIADCEILFGMFPPALVRQCPNLRWLQCSFAGVDSLGGEGLFLREDALLTNASGAYGITIAEHMICVLLMMLRRMPEYQALTARRGWEIIGDVRAIYGSTVTVIGMGDIGSSFGRRIKAMGAAVRGVRRTQAPAPDWCDEAYTIDRLEEALQGADVAALCLPGTADTRHIFGQEQIEAMNPAAYVLNVGRGTAIDQQALAEALRSGRLAGAALDVADPEPLPPEHFLWDTPNLLLTPHVSGNMSLAKTCQLVIDIFLENLSRWDKGQPLAHVVDLKRGY